MKNEPGKELRILLKQKSETTNKVGVDQAARDLKINYRTKEIEAIDAKLTFYLYMRSVIHAKRMSIQ